MMNTTDYSGITKEQFDAYRRVQEMGDYNMVTEAHGATLAAGLDEETYWTIVWNYGELFTKFN